MECHLAETFFLFDMTDHDVLSGDSSWEMTSLMQKPCQESFLRKYKGLSSIVRGVAKICPRQICLLRQILPLGRECYGEVIIVTGDSVIVIVQGDAKPWRPPAFVGDLQGFPVVTVFRPRRLSTAIRGRKAALQELGIFLNEG